MNAREVVAALKADGWAPRAHEGLARAVSSRDQARSGDGPDTPGRLAGGHAREHREADGRQVAGETMRYPAVVTKEGKNLLTDLPTRPGCHTSVPPGHA